MLKDYQRLDQTQSARSMLTEAITQGFTRLVKKALQDGAIPTQEHLQLAQQQYSKTGDDNYKDIGKMLIHTMGLTEKQSCIAKTGIQTVLKTESGVELPPEIIEVIRTFLP